MKQGWVYIMTNAPFGTLYIGVTSDLATRIWQHKNSHGSEFCREHGLTRLVYWEHHDHIDAAIAREKAMKAWKRVWKTRLIEQHNPAWDDLYEQINY
ncbi:GIY-YIG nuclease family protein [Sphingomonas cavernae]|uniref:GIY-YIG nuclease family protein n=1 Tax=Sphingomonas cavernae TaxID=2320861 RepID=A0A418W6F5_9SPHN|nr:GIY-YIG nuclease family protein [Sphingomonas cavernae]RJF85504.1 GIY-YIG nuclease family protein [Sphingomonas cavernae]